MGKTRVGKTSAASRRAGTREKIVRATAELLAEGGREAASTRAVSAAAGVQATAIYRLFGDMRGLLDEVARFGFSEYLRGKVEREVAEDPVEDLRRGWDLHVGFGLANPALITLMYGDFGPGGAEPAAVREGAGILRGLVRRVAEAGRLRVSVERAAAMIQAAGTGVVLSLIATGPEDRDPALSEATREAVLAAITTGGSEADAEEAGRGQAASRAVALRAGLPELEADLTFGERAILSELLDRIADPARRVPAR